MLVESSPFQMTIACEAERWTVHLSGDVDARGASDLLDVALVLARRRVAQVVFDVGRMHLIDPAGMAALAEAAGTLEAAGTRVRLVGPDALDDEVGAWGPLSRAGGGRGSPG